jgi:PTH2 family peptidyl-tRNA hydrolase
MKQAIVVRTDLGMGTGKLAAQVAHASLRAADAAPERDARAWRDGGAKKVVLAADSDEQLFALAETADRAGLPNAVIRDAGHTQVEPDTVTALGVGPADERAIDEVTGELSLL